MIRSSILKTKVTKEALVENQDEKNDSTMNDQNEDENYTDSALVKEKEKDKTRPSEVTEETDK